ncbi:MAG: ferritin-like domain-containing protein [Deltaproteobacteria bacterium]|nr:ferritin-like domain-containing protein [Deltaproteobacteria bacterium]
MAADDTYDFGDARFDLNDPADREILRFILSQALYGEATGVYCGKSLYSAGSLEAAKFYLRQAKQEIAHLQLFADIFRALDMEPLPAHWVIKLLSSHNNYYPLKVLMEHAIGEGMVLDIFRDILLQTLPDEDPRVPLIKKKLRVVCREEEEHVAWGEKETRRLLAEKPWLRTPYYGLVELQMSVLPLLVRAFEKRAGTHPVLAHLPGFLAHVRSRVYRQSKELGIVPEERPSAVKRGLAMGYGLALFVRSQFAKSESKLEKIYISELGLDRKGGPSGGSGPLAGGDDDEAPAKAAGGVHALS